MKIEIIEAENYCESVRDGTHDTPRQVDKGYKLVTAKHIINGQIDLSDAYLISESDYLKICERSKVDKWDVLMSMIGNGLGKSAVVKDNPKYAIKNLALFKIGDEIKAKWLHYYLSSYKGQSYIYNSLQGSGQPFISLSVIRKFPIPVPVNDLLMKRIVMILSRYDSLIENYQRQIKLLEEAAQRLYKEWFVDLHFPGHENTPIIDGIPEGWEKKKLGEIIETTSGGTPSRRKENFFSGSILWVKTKELNDGFIFDTEEKITEEALNQSSAKMVPEGSLLLAMYGATIGKLGVAGQSLSCNQACCVFLLNSKEYYRWFLYNWLMYNRTFLISQGKGAAQPNLSQELIKNFEIVIPSSNLLMIFHRLADKIYTESAKLQAQIRNLTEARDRLLPKLMSGEILICS